MAAYMGPSFTCEAAQDRECVDLSVTPGRGEQQGSPRIEYYAIQGHRTIRAKGDRSFWSSDRRTFETCRSGLTMFGCSSGPKVNVIRPARWGERQCR